MIAAGGSPSSRSFKPPPQPFLVRQFQHNQQQQLQLQQQQQGLRLWKQEDAQKQFVPLQAVKQQLMMKVTSPNDPEPDISAELANNLTLKTDTKSNKLSPADRPNSVSAKPFVSRPRKSRLAANFNLNVQNSQ
ncbi:hypothetical protein C0J52_24347 [Blattella germanica]|nr:hypothetical protein C0J52_24347 [Blattella germanica]